MEHARRKTIQATRLISTSASVRRFHLHTSAKDDAAAVASRERSVVAYKSLDRDEIVAKKFSRFFGDEVDRESGLQPPVDDATLAALSARIVTACVLAGLDLSDAQDTSQDIIEWFISSGTLALAASLPWLNAVIRNFILRYRRRMARERKLQSAFGRTAAESSDPTQRIEFDEAAQQVLNRLRGRDRAVFRRIIGEGFTFAESAKSAAILPGSRGRVRERLRRISGRLFSR